MKWKWFFKRLCGKSINEKAIDFVSIYNILIENLPIKQLLLPQNIFHINKKSTYLKLKSKLNLFPHPSKVHWKGFSPVCTNWCLFNLLDSTKAFPHSAQTWTLGPWVCKCFLMAELSRNILLHPLCGQAVKNTKC